MKINFEYGSEAFKKSQYFDEIFLEEQWQKFQETINRSDIGFFQFTDDLAQIEECEKLYQHFSKIKNFVHIGIGGSALGPKMLLQAFNSKNKLRNFFFWDNIDSDYIAPNFSKLNPKETLFFVVSKSGNTPETLALFSIAANWLQQHKIAPEQFKNHFVICTDNHEGNLGRIATENQIPKLMIPQNVGGRFSVLTSVGLFPALFSNINIRELYDGAQSIKKEIMSESLKNNPILEVASYLTYLKKSEDIDRTVMMPYSSLLNEFSNWFVQLWAESLGKKYSLDNKIVHEGLSPIPAIGATDQHSQMQLFVEGPNKNCLIFIEIIKSVHNFRLKGSLPIDLFKNCPSETNLATLMKAELEGTIKVFKEQKRPFIRVTLDEVNEHQVARLIVFIQCLTALMGEFLNINPFNQPGVEAAKINAREYLNSLVE